MIRCHQRDPPVSRRARLALFQPFQLFQVLELQLSLWANSAACLLKLGQASGERAASAGSDEEGCGHGQGCDTAGGARGGSSRAAAKGGVRISEQGETWLREAISLCSKVRENVGTLTHLRPVQGVRRR